MDSLVIDRRAVAIKNNHVIAEGGIVIYFSQGRYIQRVMRSITRPER